VAAPRDGIQEAGTMMTVLAALVMLLWAAARLREVRAALDDDGDG
jgi:hypothetical protein